MEEVPDTIVLSMSKDKNYLTKPELFMLDLLAGYQWDRPISMLNMGGDLNIGIKEYLMYDCFSYRFVPFKNKVTYQDIGKGDPLALYRMMTDGTFTWDALSRKDYFVDYQNLYTFLGVLSQRQMFVTVANALINAGEKDKAMEILDKCQECIPEETFPLETIPVGFTTNTYMGIRMAEMYYFLHADDKGDALAEKIGNLLLNTMQFYGSFATMGQPEFEAAYQALYYLEDVLEGYKKYDLATKIADGLSAMIKGLKAGLDD